MKALAQTTILKNGLSVVSNNSPGHFASIGVYIRAGSRFEDVTSHGISHFIHKMAFKSTHEYESSELVNQIESIGGNFQSQASREFIMYQANVFKHDVNKAASILSSIIQRPIFSQKHVDETKETIDFEIDELSENPNQLLPEILHSVAYNQNTLGNPVLSTKESLESISSNSLHRYKSLWFTPERIVISGSGLDHNILVDLAAAHFGNLPSSSKETMMYQQSLSIPAQYTGGSKFIDTSSLPPYKNPDSIPLTHLYLGFESFPLTDPDVYALATLASLLGGGGSFSAGGPGKGMYSRLYQNVLNQHYWVENCNHFNFTYSDSGLFGIHMSATPRSDVHKIMGPVLLDQLLATTHLINDEQFHRAKNQLKSNMLMGLERKQILLHGRLVEIKEACKAIDDLVPKDLTRVARRVILGQSHHQISNSLNNEGTVNPFTRSGKGNVSCLVQGPLKTNDHLYKIEEVCRSWGLVTSDKSKEKTKYGIFK